MKVGIYMDVKIYYVDFIPMTLFSAQWQEISILDALGKWYFQVQPTTTDMLFNKSKRLVDCF